MDSSTPIHISCEEHGLTAKIQCPVCPTECFISCRPERSGTWKISNFVAHIRNVHKIRPPSKELPGDRKRTISELDDSNEYKENFPDNSQSSGKSTKQDTLQATPQAYHEIMVEEAHETMVQIVEVVDFNNSVINSSAAVETEQYVKDPLAVSQMNSETLNSIIEEADVVGLEQPMDYSEITIEELVEELVPEEKTEDTVRRSENT